MTEMFEKQKTVIIEEYERKLKELEARMNSDFETMRTEMQAKIDDLVEQLRRERESLQGGVEQLRTKMQAEIDELKR